MKILLYPQKNSWPSLCRRPASGDPELDQVVSGIISKVRSEGDNALRFFSGKFGGPVLNDFRVSTREISRSEKAIPETLKQAIHLAQENIVKFHKSRFTGEHIIETSPGVKCWRKNVPVEKVGLYIPGGTAPLFSTVLMLSIPAKLAGCSKIILCTPPDDKGVVNPFILYAASLTGVTDVFMTGGAQAIAAMAYGTETIPKVDKIFGPGNQYVTRAKELVQAAGIPIDLPAGPSEVLIIADESSEPSYVASDLLAQAEHGPDSQVVLLTSVREMIPDVKSEVERQLRELPRRNIAAASLENSLLIALDSIEECMDFSNMYAPEHLIISTADPYLMADKVRNAGSVFLGKLSCESAGDYASGTNHTLPTNGYARSWSGVTVGSFMKTISFQEISPSGLINLGPAIELMASAEQLEGHKNAVTIRLNSLKNV